MMLLGIAYLMRKPLSYHFLRLGLAATYVAIGVLIFRDPDGWGALIQPWAARLMPVSIHWLMLSTAALDVAVGILLLIDILSWAAAAIGAIHILTVFMTVGLIGDTVRDMAILGGSASLALSEWPEHLKFWKKKNPV
jgi:uncharacterized membrane protein YphA (DoxX/SURF4 family)